MTLFWFSQCPTQILKSVANCGKNPKLKGVIILKNRNFCKKVTQLTEQQELKLNSWVAVEYFISNIQVSKRGEAPHMPPCTRSRNCKMQLLMVKSVKRIPWKFIFIVDDENTENPKSSLIQRIITNFLANFLSICLLNLTGVIVSCSAYSEKCLHTLVSCIYKRKYFMKFLSVI